MVYGMNRERDLTRLFRLAILSELFATPPPCYIFRPVDSGKTLSSIETYYDPRLPRDLQLRCSRQVAGLTQQTHQPRCRPHQAVAPPYCRRIASGVPPLETN